MDERCSLRLTRRFAAPIDEVWRALTDPPSVRRWLGGLDVEVVDDGRVAAVRFPDSVATIELTGDGERTVLVLEHERVAAPLGMRLMRSWTVALDRFAHEVPA